MISATSPHGARSWPRPLQLLQWAVLLPLVLSLATRMWYRHEWLALILLVLATLIWLPELRRGERRWWFFYVAGLFIYTLLRAQADNFVFPVQMDYVIHFDKWLFRGVEPVVWLQSQFFRPPHVGTFDVIATQVHWSFFVVPHALAAAIYVWRRELFSRYVVMLLSVEFLGLVCFYLVPTAPPWLAAQYGEIGPAYRVMNFVGGSLNAETYQTLYSALGEPNSVAAVPSIHMAVTFAGYLWMRRYMPGTAPLFLVYSILMGLSLLHLAEHYVFDLLAGVLLAVAVDVMVARRYKPLEPAVSLAAVAPPAKTERRSS